LTTEPAISTFKTYGKGGLFFLYFVIEGQDYPGRGAKMYLTGIGSLWDEVSWGSDLFMKSSLYKLQTSYLSRGKIEGYDTDYYRIDFPYSSGTFKITVSNDSVNNWGTTWSTGFVSAEVVDYIYGAIQANLTTSAYGSLDGTIYVTWNGGYSTNDYYLKLSGYSDANYVVKFENYYSVPATDTTAPTISSFSPTDGATGVATTANIVITFSEAIQLGTGIIGLWNASSGSYVETFDVASSRLTVSGSTLTIDPVNALANNTSYYVVFESGNIKDLAGNAYAGTYTYDFTTVAAADTIAPTVITFNPTDEATGIAVNSSIVITFSEAIQRGTGNIILKTTSGTAVAAYDAATSSNLSISGSTLTINPTADLASGTGYKVEFASGTIKDLDSNSYAGTTTYDFTTVAPPPTVKFFSPADASTNVALDSNITMVFSEAVQRGTGSIILKTATGTIVETFDTASSGSLNISGSTLTINPTNNISNSTQYFVIFAAGSIKDLAGNNYTGTTAYDFTTVAAAPDPDIPSPDRVFNWSESLYPSLFPNHSDSIEIFGYYARMYLNGNALGEKDGGVYFYDGGPDGDESITLVGTIEGYLAAAIAAGF
jgi:methionine-rich copper-binding protein CopC